MDRYISASRAAPREFLTEFFRLAGVEISLPDPLPATLATGAQLLMSCRYPWLARFPFQRLRNAPFHTLVISGGHSAVFESICDLLTTELNAERDVLSGAGHAVPRLGHAFNQRLEKFLRAQTRA